MQLTFRLRTYGDCQTILRIELTTSLIVKVFGCRPMKVARRTPGPASANLQGRKPRERIRGWRGVRYGDLSAADEAFAWGRAD